jgi:hypothetical protein
MIVLLTRKHTAVVSASLALIAVAILLSQAAWPWWAWLPASLIASVIGGLAPILLGYAYYRLRYQRICERNRPAPISTRPPQQGPR